MEFDGVATGAPRDELKSNHFSRMKLRTKIVAVDMDLVRSVGSDV